MTRVEIAKICHENDKTLSDVLAYVWRTSLIYHYWLTIKRHARFHVKR